VVVEDAVIRQDTVFGQVKNHPVMIPLTDVASLEQEHLSASRTLLTVVAVPAALAGALYLIACDDGACQPDY
jgi:hypothetical protein